MSGGHGKHNMVEILSGKQSDFPSSATIHWSNSLAGYTEAWGVTVPTDATAGYAPGCTFKHTDGGSGTALYVNEGSSTSCDFNLVATPNNIGAMIDEGLPPYGTAAGRGPSPLIWNSCPVLDYNLDPTLGYVYFNDFVDGGYVLAANQTVTHLNQGVCGMTAATGGTTISQLADEPTGVVALNSTTDDEDAAISVLGGVNTAGQVLFTSGKQTWFEARIKSLNITDTKFGIFCGFMEEGLLATTAMIAAAGSLADKDYFGFHKLEADGDKLDVVFNTESGTASPTTVQADAVTLVADTYKKIGIYSDGTTITMYADGVALSSTTTIAAVDFPDGQEMAFYFVAMNAHGDTSESCIDWVRVAVEF